MEDTEGEVQILEKLAKTTTARLPCPLVMANVGRERKKLAYNSMKSVLS